MKFRYFLAFFVIFILVFPISLFATAQREVSDDNRSDLSDRILPFNPEIRTGTLSNGMEYYILEHPYPDNQVSLRLVVDAGSMQEEEDQRGLAHFVEHMAFNGTRDFGETELVAYLESLGIRFGPEVNAFTSFDETVYQLELPSDDPTTFETGFHVLSQWAGYLSLDPEAVDRERGIIVEEWRGGRGASRRMMEQHIPVLFQGTLYAERLPIGDMDIVRTAPADRLRSYYHRWYRPDNMAIIAVGDLDVDRTENLIRRYMGTLSRPATPLNRSYVYLPENGDHGSASSVRVSVASDPEASRSTVSIYDASDPAPFQTVADYRHRIVRALYAAVVNERLRDRARDPDAPLQGGGIGWTRFVRTADLAVATVSAREGRVEESFSLLLEELQHASRYGVTMSELERMKGRFLSSIEESYINRNSASAAGLADELVRHVLEGEAVPGIEEEYRIYNERVPEITVDEVNAVGNDFLATGDLIVTASLREDDRTPDLENRLATLLRNAPERAVAPPENPSAVEGEQTILSRRPVPGTVMETIEHSEPDIEELVLSNGVRVYLMTTNFREDEVIVRGFSPGGLSLVDDADAVAARLAVPLQSESGLGTLQASDLEKWLADSSASLGLGLYDNAEAFSAGSRVQDLDDLFEMIYAFFQEPRFDETALERIRLEGIQATQSQLRDPAGSYYRHIRTILTGGDPRALPLTVADYESVNLQEIEQTYRQRFSNPADWIFTIVGSVTAGEILPYIETYLASIPGPEPGDAWNPERAVDHGYSPPEGIVDEVFHAGIEPTGQVTILFTGDYAWGRSENQRFNSTVDLLDTILRERIREESGGSYGIGAAGMRRRTPEPRYLIQIEFDCDPDRADELTTNVFAILSDLAVAPVDENHLERIKAQQREEYEQSLTRNAYWASVIEFAVRHGRDLETVDDYPELIESVTVEDLRQTIAAYLTPESYIRVTLVPE